MSIDECDHNLTMVIYPDRTVLQCVNEGCDYEEPYDNETGPEHE